MDPEKGSTLHVRVSIAIDWRFVFAFGIVVLAGADEVAGRSGGSTPAGP